MLSVLNFFLGWVLIEVRGAYVERFLNLCSCKSISFWGMERHAPDMIRVCVTVRDFRRLPECAKRAMCRVHIVSKHGIRFFTVRLKKRAVLVAGLVIVIAAAWVMTSFIWSVEISAPEGMDVRKLERALRQNGVYKGAPSWTIDTEDLKNDILIKIPEISYIGVNLSGSRAYVQVRERIVPPELEADTDVPSNIVARRGGIITSIVVQSGTQEVGKGDAVFEGQLLAGGYMTGRSGNTVPMRAKAQVRAKTWYTVTSLMPLDTLFKTYSGCEIKRRTLVLGEKRIKLYGNSRIPYEECDKIIDTTVLTLPGDLRLPLKLETETVREYVTQAKSISPETALEYLSSRLDNALELAEGARVLERRYTAGFKGNVARVTMTAECEEEIGVEQKLPKASE